MVKIILGVEGMKCPKCEAHMNQAVKQNLKVKSVESSHADNRTVIVAKEPVDESKLGEIVTSAGYKMTSVKIKAYEKKGLFSFGK